MENPVSKLARLDGRERERRNGSELEELSTTSTSSVASASTATAPAHEPSPSPEAKEHHAHASSAAAPEADPRAAGFTSTIGHLSLYGWLRWIHANRSDATLRIRSQDDDGTIWCSGGQIIDAEWRGYVAEEALAEMLPCSSGAVTIDFEPVLRPCRITTPTHQLLHVTEGGAAHDVTDRGAAARDTGQIAAGPAPQTGAARKDRFTELALLLAESIAPVASGASQPPKRPRRWVWRSGYLAGAVVVAALAVAGFAVGRLRATNGLVRSSPAEQAPAPPPRPAPPPPAPPTAPASTATAPAASGAELPVITPRARELQTIPFVSIEVEPAHAEIWLDRELVGRGALQLAAIHDGMLHELRFTAPEHETKTLFFRSAPPAGRVLLNQVAERDAPAANAADAADPTLRAAADGVAAAAPKRITRPRAAAPASPPSPRTRALPPDSPSQTKPAAQRSPRVELIEVHAPRVQVLD